VIRVCVVLQFFDRDIFLPPMDDGAQRNRLVSI
jgi:hypothetical protein